LVWCSIEYQWRNEWAINFICTLFYFVGAFGGIRIICTNSKAITERVLNYWRKLQKKSTQRKKLLRFKRNVTFKNVAFSYPSRKEIKVLKDVNLHGKFWSKIAIVGPSGKINHCLITAVFYDIDSGDIIDGKIFMISN
jgi:ABC-type multidrug transport system fused ATPase/permease subunit